VISWDAFLIVYGVGFTLCGIMLDRIYLAAKKKYEEGDA